jgi:5-methylcytosine-specific restriction endonuclease McrA
LKEYASKFYKSKAWKDCRSAYLKSKGGLCERCLAQGIWKPGEIVHHKIHITPDNINNPNIILDWNNLELVCRDCHRLEHDSDIKHGRSRSPRRYRVDENGKIIFNC